MNAAAFRQVQDPQEPEVTEGREEVGEAGREVEREDVEGGRELGTEGAENTPGGVEMVCAPCAPCAPWMEDEGAEEVQGADMLFCGFVVGDSFGAGVERL